MARAARSRACFEIYNDSTYSEEDYSGKSINHGSNAYNCHNDGLSPLGIRSVEDAQNRKLPPSSQVETITTELRRLRIGESPESKRVKSKANYNVKTTNRLTRRPLTSNTFDVLATVSEDEEGDPSGSTGASVSDDSQDYLELPVDQYTRHPLALAARRLPSAEEQVAKHRRGNFEWLLTIKSPIASTKQPELADSHLVNSTRIKRAFFGCNLLPGKTRSHQDPSSDSIPACGYKLLVTPLEENEELLEACRETIQVASMAVAADEPVTPVKGASPQPGIRVELTPASTNLAGGADASVEIMTSSAPKPAARIEDSIEALDQLEEQLEAFTTSPHHVASVKSASATQKKKASKGLASLQPPKQLAKSSKVPTRPTFELPGEAVARRLKEQREARLAAQTATGQKPTPTTTSTSTPNLRRTKSARVPTVPNFELPGEAISRRKRAEHEARLKAQEEEERKRREFKARPIHWGHSAAPRGTVASRARQHKADTENTHSGTTNKRQSMMGRQASSNTDNQSEPRGRLLTADSASTSKSRASSSTGSISGKRSSVSVEDLQRQHARGRNIYENDSAVSHDRVNEKHHRESMAKSAREEAAERSRMLSRQWAEKQKRKRMSLNVTQNSAP